MAHPPGRPLLNLPDELGERFLERGLRDGPLELDPRAIHLSLVLELLDDFDGPAVHERQPMDLDLALRPLVDRALQLLEI